MLSDKNQAQINRLKLPSNNRSVLYDVEFKISKNDRYGYRILKKSHKKAGDSEWTGTRINCTLEIYTTTGAGFATIEAATADALKWMTLIRKRLYLFLA